MARRSALRASESRCTSHPETGVVILHDEAVDRANFSLELPVTVEKIL